MILPPLYILHLFCGITKSCMPITPEVKVNHIARSNGEDLDTSNSPIVHTLSGWVEGYYQKTITGRPVAAFEGIPFAKAPIGQLRFRSPVPIDPWTGVRRATKPPPLCLQMDARQLLRIDGVEDCLQLSIYTPKIDLNVNETGLPVIFHIHGGGFSWWTGNFGPSYLLDKDVILVTSNHRVGVLGFLSTGDEVASGNWGLKDQLLALKWVSNNIKHFGGNPNKITISGMSTGAAAAALHVVSRQTRGLISGAICEGGSATGHFSIINETVSTSKLIARRMGCPTGNSNRMVDCLRSKDPSWMVGQLLYAWKELIMFRLPMGPVIEPAEVEDAFLVEDPTQSYLKGNVNRIPMINGINRDEGGLFAASVYVVPLMLDKFNKNWNRMSSYAFSFDEGEADNAVEVSRKIKEYYLNRQEMNFENRNDWMKIFGDRGTVVGNYHSLQYHSTIAPTYGYLFNHEGDSLTGILLKNPKEWGISHADTTIYLYNSTNYLPLEYGTRDYKMSQFLVNLWSNFASTGVPYYTDETGQQIDFWSAVKTPQDVQVLQIDKNPKMIPYPFKDRVKFWENLHLRNIFTYPDNKRAQVK